MPFNLARQCQEERHAACTRNPHTQLCSLVRKWPSKRWCGVQRCGEGECLGPRTSLTTLMHRVAVGCGMGCHLYIRLRLRLRLCLRLQVMNCGVRGVSSSEMESQPVLVGVRPCRSGRPCLMYFPLFSFLFSLFSFFFSLFSFFLPFPSRACWRCFGEGPCAGPGRWRGGARWEGFAVRVFYSGFGTVRCRLWFSLEMEMGVWGHVVIRTLMRAGHGKQLGIQLNTNTSPSPYHHDKYTRIPVRVLPSRAFRQQV